MVEYSSDTEPILDLPILHCKRCQWDWTPRTPRLPKVCPKCKSPYWNRERQRQRAPKTAKASNDIPSNGSTQRLDIDDRVRLSSDF